MKKVLIGLLVVFVACNTAEFPDKRQESIQTHRRRQIQLPNAFRNGYDKKECKTAFYGEGDGRYALYKFYRIVIDDREQKPCITKYAYAVNNWDALSFAFYTLDENATIFVNKRNDYLRLYKKLCLYYHRPWRSDVRSFIENNKGLEECNFFKRQVFIPGYTTYNPYCMIFRSEYVTLLAKAEVEEYLKNHPETVNLGEDKLPRIVEATFNPYPGK